MNFIKFFIISTLGFLVSVPSSMIGLGGGFLLVPILILILKLPARNAIAVSLVAITGTTVSATLGYIKQKKVDYKLGLMYDILDVPGVILGAYVTTLLDSNVLASICGIFLVFLSITLARGGIRKKKAQIKNFQYSKRKTLSILVSSFFGGFMTGLSGLGGGVTDTSTMILLGVPPHVAVASSEFAMAVTNGFGVIAHGILDNILLEYALPLTLGTIIGAQVGCLFCKRIKANVIRKVLSALVFIIGLRLIFSL
jgi:hypothetical protein